MLWQYGIIILCRMTTCGNYNMCEYDNLHLWQFAFMTICIYDTMQKWIYMTMCGYDNLYDNMQIWHCTVMTKFGRNNIRACQNAECRYNNMWIWQYVDMTITRYDTMRKCWHTLFSMMERILYLGWFEQWEPLQRPGC